jgi:nucleoside phosphorylase
VVLTDLQAADMRVSKEIAQAHGTVSRAIHSGRGNQGLRFSNALHSALQDLVPRAVSIYAELEEATDPAHRDELVAALIERVTAFIKSSVASVRGVTSSAAAREGARLIASYSMSIPGEFDLAVHAAAKMRAEPSERRAESNQPVATADTRAQPPPEVTAQADLLLVVTTDVEHTAVIDAWKAAVKRRAAPALMHGEKRTYDDLGVVAGARVAMVQTQMGTATVGGSLSTIQTAIRELQPKTLIMVGIAFGVDPEKQPIGTVLVSERVHQYELQRIGTDADGAERRIHRGDKASASPETLSRLRSANRTSPAQFGLLLSGEKLVDNHDYRGQLREIEPEAIGGEMEGGGLYVAATEERRAWCIVKAVCDWADGNKGKDKAVRQRRAAETAAAYVMRAVVAGGFAVRESSPPSSTRRKRFPVALAIAGGGVIAVVLVALVISRPTHSGSPEVDLSPNSIDQIEERLEKTKPVQVFHVASIGDYAAVFELLDSMTETKSRTHLSPVSLTLKVTGPIPDQVTYKQRMNVVDATAYVQGLRTEGKYPLDIGLYFDNVTPVGPEGMQFKTHSPAP